MNIVPPSAGDLGLVAGDVNIPVVFHIRVSTSRYSSEWATDFIKRGRPFVFEVLINGSDTAAQVATKMVETFAQYEAVFNLADNGLPFTYVDSTGSVDLVLKDPYLQFQKDVEFILRGLTYGVKATTTVTAGSEPAFDGKYLEENVRMSLPSTSDSYGISPDERPFINSGYATITWTSKAPIDGHYEVHQGIWNDPVDSHPSLQTHQYTLYLNEDSDLIGPDGAGSYAETLVNFLISAPGGAAVNLVKADGTVVATYAEWVA